VLAHNHLEYTIYPKRCICSLDWGNETGAIRTYLLSKEKFLIIFTHLANGTLISLPLCLERQR